MVSKTRVVETKTNAMRNGNPSSGTERPPRGAPGIAGGAASRVGAAVMGWLSPKNNIGDNIGGNPEFRYVRLGSRGNCFDLKLVTPQRDGVARRAWYWVG